MQLYKEQAPGIGVGDMVKGSGVIAMGSLLANMNHDIRTSMNGVRGMLELLLDTGLTPSQQQYARSAQHSVDNLLESLERIVDMSLIKSNQFRLNRVPFDLLQEMKVAMANKEASARSKGVALSIHYPPSILLYGDAARLRELVSSLVDSVLHGTEGGTVTVAMSAASTAPGRCDIRLSVHVAGKPEESARLSSRLLNPAYADARHQPLEKDTLGPTLCASLAHVMGGSISVSPLPGQGTLVQFSVDLPLAVNTLSGIRVLAVCENANEWESAFSLLTQQGIGTDIFDNVLPALAAIESASQGASPYQVIMIGRRVQGLDAAVLASAIKASPAYREALLVLLDDEADGDTDCLERDGFAAHLCKSAASSIIESGLIRLCSTAVNRESAPCPPAAAASPDKKEEDTFFSDYRILVADDNIVNQQVAAHMLEKLGCKSELAADGMQAVDMQTTTPFDLILMDCEMPVMDGLQAAQRIRASEGSARRTPIIALTACTGQGEQEQCLAAGMDDFLSKPIRPQQLKDTLARWLPRSGPIGDDAPTATYSDELEMVREMFGADFSELAALYQNDGQPRLTAIRNAYLQGDLGRVAKIAHAFSGSSASIGATSLSSLTKEVETNAKAGSLSDFEKKMRVIEAEYQRICDKLQSMLKS